MSSLPSDLTSLLEWQQYFIRLALLCSLPLILFLVVYSCTACMYYLQCIRSRGRTKRQTEYGNLDDSHFSSSTDYCERIKNWITIFTRTIFSTLTVSFAIVLLLSCTLFYSKSKFIVRSSDNVLTTANERVRRLTHLIDSELDSSVNEALQLIEVGKESMYTFIDKVSQVEQLCTIWNIFIMRLKNYRMIQSINS